MMSDWLRFTISSLRRVFKSMLLLAAGLLPCACAFSADWRWQEVPRVVAVSDVHGADEAFVRTLVASGLLNEDGHWSGNGTHLVITGDLLDRGAGSRIVMDLLMRLEGEALAAGGRVHLLLGNHEVMNLVGDLRYVARGEYAAFAAEEDPAERAYWLQQFQLRAGPQADAEAIRTEFDRRHPPGFFAHRRAFRPDGQYGAWLLDKPLLVVIDATAFVHGGLAPSVAERGLEGINGDMRQRLRDYLAALDILYDYAALQPGDSFYNYLRILDALPEEFLRPPAVESAIETLRELDAAPIHASDSPLWYRGTVGCSAVIEAGRLGPVLDALQARRVVVGHTPTVTRGVLSRLDGRIVEIDTGMLAAYYKGSGHALVIEGDTMSVLDEQGTPGEIATDPRLNAPGEETAAVIEQALANGEVTVNGEREDGSLSVAVRSGKDHFSAVFHAAQKRGALPELAAYRLDRLLGLSMVPITVARMLDGRAGSLQWQPDNLMNETERAAATAGAGAWCPLPAQWQAMYRFDSLTNKRARSADDIRYDKRNWQLVLSGHGDAFGTGRGRPDYLKSVEVTMDDAWQTALARLSDETLDAELGEILDSSRLRALKRRRDALLNP